MALTFDTAFRNEAITALSELYEGGTITIYTSGDDPLVTINVPAEAFAAASNGTAALASPLQSVITASGTAAKYVATTSGGGTEEGTVTATAGGGDMELDDTELVENGTASIVSWSNSYPSSS